MNRSCVAAITLELVLTLRAGFGSPAGTSTPSHELPVESYLRHLRDAEAKTRAEQWAEAAALWAKVVETNPDRGDYWSALGNARSRAGAYREAIPAYEKAIALRAGRDPAMEAILAYRERGKGEAAEKGRDDGFSVSLSPPLPPFPHRNRRHLAALLCLGSLGTACVPSGLPRLPARPRRSDRWRGAGALPAPPPVRQGGHPPRHWSEGRDGGPRVGEGGGRGASADRVDAYVAAEMKQGRIPGLSLAVVRDGRILRARGYGLANVEIRVRATRSTVYEIGSVTKPFTATAIMLLAEDGRLALDDRIARFLPDLPEAWSGVTVRHLLGHTSGIRSYTDLPNLAERGRLDTTCGRPRGGMTAPRRGTPSGCKDSAGP